MRRGGSSCRRTSWNLQYQAHCLVRGSVNLWLLLHRCYIQKEPWWDTKKYRWEGTVHLKPESSKELKSWRRKIKSHGFLWHVQLRHVGILFPHVCGRVKQCLWNSFLMPVVCKIGRMDVVKIVWINLWGRGEVIESESLECIQVLPESLLPLANVKQVGRQVILGSIGSGNNRVLLLPSLNKC